MTALVAVAQYYIYPDPAKILDLNFIWSAETLFRIMVSALGIIALQLMISVIISGFIWPFLLGILGLILNIFSLVQRINIEYSPYNVFYIMSKNNNVRSLNHLVSYSEYLSLFWMLVFLIAGYFWYAKKAFTVLLSVTKISFYKHFCCHHFWRYFFTMTKPVIPKVNPALTSITGKFETDVKIDSVRVFTKDFHKK